MNINVGKYSEEIDRRRVMSDSETQNGGGESGFSQITKGPAFNFSKPYLDFIGKEKIFSIVYYVMAVLNVLIPIVIIIGAISNHLFSGPAKFAIAFLLSWIVISFTCLIGFQLWWDRRKKVETLAACEFAATHSFSEITQTFGEWIGTFVGIIGAGVGLIATVILGEESRYLFSMIGMEFLSMGALVIVMGPVMGFFIIVISRFLAEQLRIFAALANNTRDIAVNIKDNNKRSY
jgi:tetrahydromethanopterin S-methyltransferase subunit G